jgi:hypothetical protein
VTHEACRERLVDLLYGELSPRAAREVEAHLAGCDACRAERDGLAAARGAMRELPPPAPPARGDAVVLAAARRAAQEQREDSFGGALRRFSGRLALGTGLAAIAAYVLVTWSPGNGPTEIAPAPPMASDTVAREAATPRAAPSPAGEPAAARTPPTAAQREKQSLRMDEGTPAPRIAAKGDARARPARSELEAPTPQPSPSLGGGEGDVGTPSASPSAAQPSPAPIPSPRPSPPARPAESNAMARAAAPRSPSSAPAAEDRGEAATPSAPRTALARDLEARHARGELSDAQKRFPPCPGGDGDLRRLAWLDAQGHVLKLERERAGGVLVEEWFDEAGRLREARVRDRGGWVQGVTVAPSGEERLEDAPPGAPAPDAPLPPLVRRDPAAVFFAPTGCDAARPR